MYTKPMKLDEVLMDHIGNGYLYQETSADAYGVEVELEGINIRTGAARIAKWWAQHNDGSLRAKGETDALEYVFKKPLNYKDCQEAIEVLFTYLNGPGVFVHESYRTSIHVHLNMVKETFRTVFNMMTICLILDELLVSQNGDHRIGNNFCLRARDAVGQIKEIIDSVESGGYFFNINKNHRYSSINFASLTKFGTIEFRSLECTTHKGRVSHWINTLTRIKEYSKTFDNPTEIISRFSQLGPKEFLIQALGPYSTKYLQVDGCSTMLRHGMRLAQDLAYCANWAPYKPSNKVNKYGLNEQEVALNQIKAKMAKKAMWKVDPNGNIVQDGGAVQ